MDCFCLFALSEIPTSIAKCWKLKRDGRKIEQTEQQQQQKL